jgi:hypothetical protein
VETEVSPISAEIQRRSTEASYPESQAIAERLRTVRTNGFPLELAKISTSTSLLPYSNNVPGSSPDPNSVNRGLIASA